MKKGLILLLGIISFLGINTVNAEEIYLEYDTNIETVNSYIEQIGTNVINEKINDLIDTYNNSYKSIYPYYIISLYPHTNSSGIDFFDISITCLKSNNLDYHYYTMFNASSSYALHLTYMDFIWISYRYDFNLNSFNTIFQDSSSGTYSSPSYSIFKIKDNNYLYNPYTIYYSNFDIYYYGSLYTEDTYKYQPMSYSPNDIFYIQELSNPNSYSKHNANEDFLIEPYYLYDDNISLVDKTYTEINLNKYAYVVLSLKDYNTIPDNNFSSYTNLYIKGQVCITPVYNYGLTERKDILTGTQVEGCGTYNPDFILDKMYILRDDVKNHAIYYLKPYDVSKENIVKIDSSKFNITYISEENKNNPEVQINGKIYPTIPYDDLTDTATKSEQQGYVPGVSCSLGDLNCYTENNPSNMFNDLFDKPLDMLKSVWGAIISIFELIGQFIALLPPTMQGFLLLAFGIIIVLGIIKMIL